MSNSSTTESTPALTSETTSESTGVQDASLDSAPKAQQLDESNRVANIGTGIEAALAKTVPDGQLEVELPALSEAQLAALLKTIKRKVKVNGAELEVGLDELEKDYQLKSASHEKMREAAALRKQVEEYTALLKTDPRKALKLFGVDARKLAEEELSEALEEEMMSPEAKRIRELEAKIAEREASDAAAADAKRQADELAQVPALTAKYDAEVQAALRGAGLPVTPQLMRAVAAQARRDLDDKIEINFPAIAESLSEQYRGSISEVVSNSDIQRLVALLGEEGMKKIREYDLARLKQTAPKVPVTEQAASTEPKRKARETLNEFLERRRKAAGIAD